MAKGKSCPQCGRHMYAQEEKYYPAGIEVVYACNSNRNIRTSNI